MNNTRHPPPYERNSLIFQRLIFGFHFLFIHHKTNKQMTLQTFMMVMCKLTAQEKNILQN